MRIYDLELGIIFAACYASKGLQHCCDAMQCNVMGDAWAQNCDAFDLRNVKYAFLLFRLPPIMLNWMADYGKLKHTLTHRKCALSRLDLGHVLQQVISQHGSLNFISIEFSSI